MPGDDSHDDDADDDVFVLGRRPDGEHWTSDDESRHRATKHSALWALLAASTVVAVSIALVALLVDDSSHAPASPRSAAQRWASDVVRGDRDDQRRLECDNPQSADVLSLILFAPTGAHAGPAARRGPGRWSVPVRFDEAGGSGTGASVTVVRRKGGYLIC